MMKMGARKEKKTASSSCFGILDRTGVGFFGGLVVRVCAHGVLNNGGSSGAFFESTDDYRGPSPPGEGPVA